MNRVNRIILSILSVLLLLHSTSALGVLEVQVIPIDQVVYQPSFQKNFEIKVKEVKRSHYIFSDLNKGFIILLIVAVGLGVLVGLGKINKKSATTIFVVVLIPTILLPFSADLLAKYQFNKGVEEYNTGIELVRQVRDEIYLGNYDTALTLTNAALTHFYKAKKYFEDANSLEYYLSEDTSKRIEEAIKETDEKIGMCYALKAKVYDLIEGERKREIIGNILNTILKIISSILIL